MVTPSIVSATRCSNGKRRRSPSTADADNRSNYVCPRIDQLIGKGDAQHGVRAAFARQQRRRQKLAAGSAVPPDWRSRPGSWRAAATGAASPRVRRALPNRPLFQDALWRGERFVRRLGLRRRLCKPHGAAVQTSRPGPGLGFDIGGSGARAAVDRRCASARERRACVASLVHRQVGLSYPTQPADWRKA